MPWSRYPLDLGHNFVLAHSTCNSRKGDRLPAVPHLEKWTWRNQEKADVLQKGFLKIGAPHDLPATRSIARWAYLQVEKAGGQVWLEGSVMVPLSEEWRRVMGGSAA